MTTMSDFPPDEHRICLHAENALLPSGWTRDVEIVIEGGRFSAIEAGVPPTTVHERHAIVLPGMPNLHSHAFQRAMAGLTERRGAGTDSFWTWREQMYRFALQLTPDEVEAVASQLFAEMLEAGFTRVVEFHYLHHDRDGRAYADIAEMAVRIAAAAEATGIGLTLLPVFYAHGGFGGAAPGEGQRRFLSTLDSYSRLLEGSRRAVAGLPGARVGVAPHSLRAVTPDELTHVVALAGDGPIHIHIAEQVAEVEACLAWSGTRPVAWLLEHLPVDRRWCLIHATHMLPEETTAFAATGAVAGLCPITEANLGDGIFDGRRFLEAGGLFGVGSDSNVRIDAAGELAQLEYSQRLALRERTVLAPPATSNGRTLFEAALAGGNRAAGEERRGLVIGAAADLMTLDATHPLLAGKGGDEVVDSVVFCGGRDLIDTVWAGGRRCVEAGRHMRRGDIATRFSAAMKRLLSR